MSKDSSISWHAAGTCPTPEATARELPCSEPAPLPGPKQRGIAARQLGDVMRSGVLVEKGVWGARMPKQCHTCRQLVLLSLLLPINITHTYTPTQLVCVIWDSRFCFAAPKGHSSRAQSSGWILGTTSSPKSSDALAQSALGGGGVLITGGVPKCGHSGMDFGGSEKYFSNLSDSEILLMIKPYCSPLPALLVTSRA